MNEEEQKIEGDRVWRGGVENYINRKQKRCLLSDDVCSELMGMFPILGCLGVSNRG